jgi:hypothetical protein
VKIPGLDPREPHALNYLTIEELDKLAERVEVAKEKAKEKARQRAAVKPGDRVLLVSALPGVGLRAGTMGIVLQKSAMLNSHYHQGQDDFAVAFDGFGALYVKGSMLRKAAGGNAVR